MRCAILARPAVRRKEESGGGAESSGMVGCRRPAGVGRRYGEWRVYAVGSVIISSCALAFTVFSFWWLQARRGNLYIGPPRSYAAIGSLHDRLVLRLPLVFFNDGPVPIVVRNLRIVIRDGSSGEPLILMALLPELLSKDRQLATQFPIRGREATRMVCEFQREPGNLLFQPHIYEMELQGKFGPRPMLKVWEDDKAWRTLRRFKLTVSNRDLESINKSFIAHDNPAEW